MSCKLHFASGDDSCGGDPFEFLYFEITGPVVDQY